MKDLSSWVIPQGLGLGDAFQGRRRLLLLYARNRCQQIRVVEHGLDTQAVLDPVVSQAGFYIVEGTENPRTRRGERQGLANGDLDVQLVVIVDLLLWLSAAAQHALDLEDLEDTRCSPRRLVVCANRIPVIDSRRVSSMSAVFGTYKKRIQQHSVQCTANVEA